MRAIRIVLLLVLAGAVAGVVVSDASALGFEDNPCPLIDPGSPQLKVCPDAEVGKPYTLQVLGKDGCTPGSVIYDVTAGSAPPGVSVSSSGLIFGAPTQVGRYKFFISVHDIPEWEGGASWCTDDTVSSSEFAINVVQGVQIVQRQSALTPAQLSVPYSLQFTATGVTPTSWSASSGTLPAGLTLDSSRGVLSGTPTTTGEYPFKITATSGKSSDTQAYQLAVVEALKLANPKAPGAEVGFPFRLSLQATGGRAPYKWSATGLPAGLTLFPNSARSRDTDSTHLSASEGDRHRRARSDEHRGPQPVRSGKTGDQEGRARAGEGRCALQRPSRQERRRHSNQMERRGSDEAAARSHAQPQDGSALRRRATRGDVSLPGRGDRRSQCPFSGRLRPQGHRQGGARR